MNSKERATLRSMANMLEPVMQIGKDELGEKSIEQINGLFDARELFKIKVLQNCDTSAKDLAQEIALKTNCEVIQVIGNKIVLYKKSNKPNFKHIEF